MLFLAIANISLLAFLAYQLSGREMFHPAVVFCSFWSIDLIFLWLAGDFFYPVHAQSLFIEICGAFAFCLGSWLGSRYRPEPRGPSPSSSKLITMGTWLIALSIPVYLKWLIGLVADRGLNATFLMAVRQSTLDIQGTGIVANCSD